VNSANRYLRAPVLKRRFLALGSSRGGRWSRRVRIWLLPSLAAVLLVAVDSCSSGGGSGMSVVVPEPTSLSLKLFATVSSTVTCVTAPPGDTARVFVVEQSGLIHVVKHGVPVPPPFLDLTTNIMNGGEDGLLGLAFAADYSTSGIFYVSFTSSAGDLRVTRYHVSANPDYADSSTASLVFSQMLSSNIHHGGAIKFGPDGKFYLGIGDGGPENDGNHTGQDRSDLFGSILRLNVGSSGVYTVPADNPWVSTVGVHPELWSYGLRNPWGFSFDRVTGDLYIGDVGQDAWEEVDAASSLSGRGKGANYGWSELEGTHCGPVGSCDSGGKTMPVLEYAHNSGAGECAVMGGCVYRGKAIPGLVGAYVYTDLCAAWIRSFRLVSGAATDKKSWGLSVPDSPSTVGEDANGELYFGTVVGSVYKLRP
jgi:glucose/arabinose dehydrogenase